jgi:hypothetical protein
MQCSAKQPIGRAINLYIMEICTLFVGHGTIFSIFLARQAATRDKKSA